MRLATLLLLAWFIGACSGQNRMTTNQGDQSIVMVASYRVDEQHLDAFIKTLKDTEALYRTYAVITDRPIARLQSMKDPEFLVEFIEWRSQRHLDAVMENDEIMAKWSQIKAEWKDGDFGWDR
ncbi:MAG: hypothetical protein ACYTGZ_20820, partial [Planctomycetota bacterium]